MVIAGVDISTVSTAVCVRANNNVHYLNLIDTDKRSNWRKVLDNVMYVNYIVHNDKYKDFTQSEIAKILNYRNQARLIVDFIKSFINDGSYVINIESPAYSAKGSSIVDILSIHTLLREYLIQDELSFNLITPKELKSNAARISYEPIIFYYKRTGKERKREYRNHEGVSGGDFTKHHMLRALFDSSLEIDIKERLIPYKEKLLNMSSIPKPIEDLVDAIFLSELSLN